jgi:putative lipoprotein
MLRMLTLSVMLAAVGLAGISETAYGVDPQKLGPTTAPRRTAYILPTDTITPTTSVPTTVTPTATVPGFRDRIATTTGAGGAVSPMLVSTPTVPGMSSRGPRWRLGVYSQDTDVGVRILRTVPNSPADRAGLEPNDVIVAVAGYQVGIVNGQQYDCGYEFERHADSQGNCMLLVLDSRNGQLTNLPIKLESRLAKVSGSIAYRDRIFLPQNAVATVELREAYNASSPGIAIGHQHISEIRQIPIPFEVEYDPGDVNPRKTYIVTATITAANRPLYSTVQQYAVITNGRPQTASIEVVKATSDLQTAANDERAQIEQQIINYFQTYYGRPPKPAELPMWTAYLERPGRSMFDVQAEMASNTAVYNRCQGDDARYIELLHEAVLGKKPDPRELEYWMAKLDESGGLRRPVAEEFLTAAGVPR